MLTVLYGDPFQARSAVSDGAVQVSKPSPLTRVADEPDGYLTGVSGAAAAGTCNTPPIRTVVTAPVAAERPARHQSIMASPRVAPALRRWNGT
jgi:hypothetical protein